MTVFAVEAWATVLVSDGPGRPLRRHIPPGRLFSSPYLEPPTIVEGETGQPTAECIACGAFREDVQDVPEDFPEGRIWHEVCRACRKRHGV